MDGTHVSAGAGALARRELSCETAMNGAASTHSADIGTGSKGKATAPY